MTNTLNVLRDIFESTLDQQIRYVMTPIEMLKPMLYSLKNGGKRLRPLLLLAMLEINSMDEVKKGLRSAIALEYIHTYSLIHDDLPAMDNDDLRRGQPTNHIQFDEATAILAGDALLTDAFVIIADDDSLNDNQKIRLIQQLSLAAGSQGMVAGQLKDIEAENVEITLEQLAQIHLLKTGQLFIFAAKAAAIICNLPHDVAEPLEIFTHHFGTAYQIHNDLMDVLGTEEETGKKEQGDVDLDKTTYPKVLGLDGAIEALNNELNSARQQLTLLADRTGKNYTGLSYFLDKLLVERGDKS